MGEKSALSRTIIIKFSLTRNRALAAMIIALLCVMSADLGCETLTLTTYYPAPYGVYSKMRVTKYSQSGRATPAGSRQIIRTGNLTEAPAIAGMPADAHGIWAETANRDLYVGARRDVVLRSDRPGNNKRIYLGSKTQGSALDRSTFISNMCKWVPYFNGTNTSCDALGKWTVIMAADNTERMRQMWVEDASNPGTNRLVTYMSTSGKMLCCKIEHYR